MSSSRFSCLAKRSTSIGEACGLCGYLPPAGDVPNLWPGSRQTAPSTPSDQAATSPPPESGKVTLGGYAEAFWSYNFNKPSNRITNFRGFDDTREHLHAIERGRQARRGRSRPYPEKSRPRSATLQTLITSRSPPPPGRLRRAPRTRRRPGSTCRKRGSAIALRSATASCSREESFSRPSAWRGWLSRTTGTGRAPISSLACPSTTRASRPRTSSRNRETGGVDDLQRLERHRG